MFPKDSTGFPLNSICPCLNYWLHGYSHKMRNKLILKAPSPFSSLVYPICFGISSWMLYSAFSEWDKNIFNLEAVALLSLLLWIVTFTISRYIPGSCDLTLDNKGMEVKLNFLKAYYPWNKIDHFASRWTGGGTRGAGNKSLRASAFLTVFYLKSSNFEWLLGLDRNLIFERYNGMKADELAKFLNEWKDSQIEAH